MQKEWKPIPGFSLYHASTDGEIKTFNWKGCGREAIMKPAIDAQGYHRTMLKGDDGKIRTIKVHRIIAQTFLENHGERETVNHINGIKTDNRLANLEWATRSENCKHAVRTGLMIAPTQIRVVDEEIVRKIRAEFVPHVRNHQRERLAKKYNVSESCIKGIVTGKTWKNI